MIANEIWNTVRVQNCLDITIWGSWLNFDNYCHLCKIMHLWFEQKTYKKWFSCKRYDTNDGNTVMILDGIHTKRRGTIFSRIRMHSATDTQYTLTYDTDTQYTIQLKRDTETQLTHMILWQKQTSQLEFKRKRKYCYQNFQTCILWKHSLWEKEMIFAALLLQ